MPRRYTLGRRGPARDATRARIVAAAARIYRDLGVGAASNLAIARAADVAPATVRNHFPDRRHLDEAVFEHVMADLHPPGVEIFDGAADTRTRVTRLAGALASFYERSEAWWRAYEREPQLIEAWSGGVERYYREIDGLMRAALGPMAEDDTAVAVVAAVIGPPAFFAFRARGMSSDASVALCVDLVVPWLEARRA